MWVSKLNTVLKGELTSSEYIGTINSIYTLLSVHKDSLSFLLAASLFWLILSL